MASFPFCGCRTCATRWALLLRPWVGAVVRITFTDGTALTLVRSVRAPLAWYETSSEPGLLWRLVHWLEGTWASAEDLGGVLHPHRLANVEAVAHRPHALCLLAKQQRGHRLSPPEARIADSARATSGWAW